MKRMSLNQFARLVRRVVRTLPPSIRPYLKNVVVDVEDSPDRKSLLDSGFTPDEIDAGAGLYGLCQPMKAPMYLHEMRDHPHRLVIYKLPLERDFPDPDEFLLEVRKTVIHELSHYFGFSEEEAYQLEEEVDRSDREVPAQESEDDPLEEEGKRFIPVDPVADAAVHLARIRLAALWLSQTARVVADNCFRMVVLLVVAGNGDAFTEAAWYQVAPFSILPFILFAPVNGVLANALPRRQVLAGVGGASLVLALLLGRFLPLRPDLAGWWCLAFGLNMLGAAIYSPARYALLPAAAVDARLPLARVNGLIEMGGGAGIVAGLLLGLGLHGQTWFDGFSASLAAIVGLNLVCLLTALPVEFRSDVRRPEPIGPAVAGFFADCKRIIQDAEARDSLAGLACLMALIFAGSGALLHYHDAFAPDADRQMLLEGLALVAVGVAGGSFLAGLQGHRLRVLGLVPLAATGFLLVVGMALAGIDLRWSSLLLGLMGGLANVPLRAWYQGSVPADARGNAMAVSNTANNVLQAALAMVLAGLVHLGLLAPVHQLVLVAVLGLLAAVAGWRRLLRPTVELLFDLLFFPCYRIRAHGPGIARFPLHGPVLIIANHTSWFDPLWVSKVIPRHIIPMMTSEFYDLPVMRWLVQHVVRAIRVQASKFRREAPELAEAIAVLDRGECLGIFPEGRLRRTPEPGLRLFGRGIWHVLSEKPQTPVVVCWIEGGWGSFASYDRGRPMQNKRPDFWYPIDIVVTEPQVIPPEILADHRATRRYLMQECLNARGYLGLEVPKLKEGDSDEESSEAGSGDPTREG